MSCRVVLTNVRDCCLSQLFIYYVHYTSVRVYQPATPAAHQWNPSALRSVCTLSDYQNYVQCSVV